MTGSWNALTNQPTFNASTMLLLSDGRVMVQEEGTAHWHALTADQNGSYLNGTWSNLADMAFWRRYYASGMLRDGRVVLIGGEQDGDTIQDTNKGEIYDPVTDSWTPLPVPPGWAQVGDAAGCILPDGRLMIGALVDGKCIIYDPVTNSWTNAASKAVRTNEETWVLQPDNTIVAPQCWSPYQSEKYIIASDTWQNEGTPPTSLVDSTMHEIGPGMLLYNGKTIFFGAAGVSGAGKTALYSPPAMATAAGTWSAGPDIPTVGGQTMVCNDCPATLLPNGNVLVTAAQFLNNDWGTPIHFFEYDPSANTLVHVTDPPNNGKKLYWSRLLLLPSGEVLFSPSSNDMRLYIPSGGPQNAWRPTISSVTAHGLNVLGLVGYYVLQGTQLNGLSQANMYGDDCQAATNYPLVRLRSTTTGKVFYGRTFAFSSMGVSTGTSPQSCRFAVPGLPYDDYDLVVVANGIPSVSFPFTPVAPRKPELFDGVKHVFEHYGKLVFEGDPFKWREWVVDPAEINRLKQQVNQLQNGVARLNSLIGAKQLPRVGQKIAHEASQEKEKTRE